MHSIGIDFGTTTTVAAAYCEGRPLLLANERGEQLTPSCVAFAPNGAVCVGQDAKARRVIDPGNSVYSIKRILGQGSYHSSVREFGEHYPFQLEEDPAGPPRVVTRAGKFTPTEIATILLSNVRQWPSLKNLPIRNCTLTVPTAFSFAQREALTEAAVKAGFQRVDVIDEPRAAALAYLEGNDEEQVVVVYDLGGGTFDLTVIKWGGAEYQMLGVGGDTYCDYQVVGAGGDTYLGGDDIDMHCANFVRDKVLESFRWDLRSDATTFQKLLLACETAKHLLSRHETHTLDLSAVDATLMSRSLQLTRGDIRRLCTDLVRRTFIICDEALAQAGVTRDKVDTVILSGGGCHMPMIQNGVAHYFKKQPRTVVQPDRAVAMGAAMHAGRQA